MLSLSLPWPPGVNNLFATVKTPKGSQRRIPSRRYKAWLAEAEAALSQQRCAPMIGSRVRIQVELSAPDQRERDADGYLKAPIDFLVKQGLIEGDSRRFVRGVSADWTDAEPKKPGGVRVTVVAA